jgi:GWxTD domain-containing protein
VVVALLAVTLTGAAARAASGRDRAEAAASYERAMVARREWLMVLREGRLEQAIAELTTATRLDSERVDAWVALVPLLLERRDVDAAAAATISAYRIAPRRPETALLVAMIAYRRGDLELAEGAFASALPHLSAGWRARFEDIAPIAAAADTDGLAALPSERRAERIRRFWIDHDPDPATAVNEARIEYWARIAQACFLYYDAERGEWDQRGELYARYGPPGRTSFNPQGAKLEQLFVNRGMEGDDPRAEAWRAHNLPLPYPMNVQIWEYPGLGIFVPLEDQSLTGHYRLPLSRDVDPDPHPDPAVVESGGNLIATPAGRGVFHALPPGASRLPVHAAVARFESDRGPRVLVLLECDAPPADRFTASCVVLDSSRREVDRGARELSPSACEAGARQVADFASDLAGGDYRLAVSVTDDHGRVGTFQAPVRLSSPAAGLTMSDVVITCGAPAPGATAASGGVRLDPNPTARVEKDRSLTAYFEVYRLAPDSSGTRHFEVAYTVRAIGKDSRSWLKRALAFGRRPPVIDARRDEEQDLGTRRQFINVPVQDLPAGNYRLEVRVRDRVADVETTGSAMFVKAD